MKVNSNIISHHSCDLSDQSDIPSRKIWIAKVTVQSKDIEEVDKLIVPLDKSYHKIQELVTKLHTAIRKDALRATENISYAIIFQLDNFIESYRKNRKKFRQIGFSKLCSMDRSKKMVDIVDKVFTLRTLLTDLYNTIYANLIISVFWRSVAKGDIILRRYIDKMENLVNISEKWLDSFFNS